MKLSEILKKQVLAKQIKTRTRGDSWLMSLEVLGCYDVCVLILYVPFARNIYDGRVMIKLGTLSPRSPAGEVIDLLDDLVIRPADHNRRPDDPCTRG